MLGLTFIEPKDSEFDLNSSEIPSFVLGFELLCGLGIFVDSWGVVEVESSDESVRAVLVSIRGRS